MGIILDIFGKNNIEVGEEEKFLRFFDLLMERNESVNLTAITSFPEVARKHFADSLMVLSDRPELTDLKAAFTKPGIRIIDVGSGAGFPGIPLSIALPQASVTLLDALEKRVRFLQEGAEVLFLSNAEPVHGRTEELGRDPEFRESYDIALSRAVAALPVLSEYLLPFVKPGGLMAAYKSGNVTEELSSAENAVAELGGRIESVVTYPLLGGPEPEGRSLVLIRKEKKTPDKYPRSPKKIKEKPL